MKTRLKLGDYEVVDGAPPYVIAEIGVNHEGVLDRAKLLIDRAKAGGAHCAKFQTYKADRLASRHSPPYWDESQEPAESQRMLFARYDAFGPAEYRILAEHCRKNDIEFLSTPFDLDAVAWLDPLVRFFKIASADITNIPLLRRVGRCRKPVLLSTGASSLSEIDAAIRTLGDAGAADIALLHCVLAYPCPFEEANLGAIAGLKRIFPGHIVGYSDHTMPDPGMLVLMTAWLGGAQVIEKHFTDDKARPGNDHYHAMDQGDLKRFSDNVRFVAGLKGHERRQPYAIESPARRHARRSIVAARPIAAGEILSEENLMTKRPAHGLPPTLWDEVLGRRARRPIADDQPLTWEDVA